MSMAPIYYVTPYKGYSQSNYLIVGGRMVMAPIYYVTPYKVYSQSNYIGIKRNHSKLFYKKVESRIVNRYIYLTVEGRMAMAPIYYVTPYKDYSQRD